MRQPCRPLPGGHLSQRGECVSETGSYVEPRGDNLGERVLPLQRPKTQG